jgi:hypothetical protein
MTSISEETQKHFNCILLHQKKNSHWDEDIHWDDEKKDYYIVLKWVCDECTTKGESRVYWKNNKIDEEEDS